MLRSIFLLLVLSCNSIDTNAQHYFQYRGSFLYKTDSATDPGMDSLLLSYRQQSRLLLQDTIACTESPLTKSQPESSIGNLLTDAMLTAARVKDPKVTAAILSYSAIGTDFIPPGPLTRQLIYDLLPHNDAMIIVELTGTALRALCDSIALHKGWPLSGIRFVIDSNKAIQISVNGNTVQDNRIYKIACNELLPKRYMSRQQGPAWAYKKTYCSVSVPMAVILYLQQWKSRNECLHSVLDNRIHYAD